MNRIEYTKNKIMSNSNTNVGRVKWFNGKRGFGFITDLDDASDVFVHHSGLVTNKDCWKNLMKGEYVEYSLSSDKEVTEGSSEPRVVARNVTGIRGGPLICESNAEDNARRRRNRRGEDTAAGGDVAETS
tara:strand:- start:270 stop:659 length:390 start_codon:yes stop_codon:yes gene_type:complete